jgi:hypothetical protein
MLIGLGRFGERNCVRDDKRRMGLSDGDEIAQCAIVRFYVGLARANGLSLLPQEAPLESNPALFA